MMGTPRFRDAETSVWDEKRRFVLVVQAAGAPAQMGASWFTEHRAAILRALDQYGVVFFRGFATDVGSFESAVDIIAPESVSIRGSVSPRHQIQGSVYSSTDIPADVGIVQHHEMAYHNYTPHFISFYCDKPADEGGVTSLCDSRHVLKTMNHKVVEALEAKGALYVRNFSAENPTPLMTWESAYGSDDKAAVERMLRESGVEWEWVSPTWLRTKQRRPAILRDANSHDRVLFACVLLWSQAYFGELARRYQVELPVDPWNQWYASFVGDGTPIPQEFIQELAQRYAEQAVCIPWQRHDFMIVNNLIASHGRTPSVGARRIFATLRQARPTSDLI